MWQQIQRPVALLALGLMMVLTPQAFSQRDRDKDDVITTVDHAWVKLFDTKDYRGERLSINYPKSVRDFRNLDSDKRGTSGNNIAASAHYQIPRGWALRLYTKPDFQGDSVDLRGTGRPVHKVFPEGMNNKISSAKWVRLDNDRESDDRDWRWERRPERDRD